MTTQGLCRLLSWSGVLLVIASFGVGVYKSTTTTEQSDFNIPLPPTLDGTKASAEDLQRNLDELERWKQAFIKHVETDKRRSRLSEIQNALLMLGAIMVLLPGFLRPQQTQSPPANTENVDPSVRDSPTKPRERTA